MLSANVINKPIKVTILKFSIITFIDVHELFFFEWQDFFNSVKLVVGACQHFLDLDQTLQRVGRVSMTVLEVGVLVPYC